MTRAARGETCPDQYCSVLRLVAAGLTNPQIDRRLRCPDGTAKYVIHRLCVRWGVANRAAAVTMAHQKRLIDLDQVEVVYVD